MVCTFNVGTALSPGCSLYSFAEQTIVWCSNDASRGHRRTRSIASYAVIGMVEAVQRAVMSF